MATARLLLGSTPYIISVDGYSASASIRGVSAANLSTTAGVSLRIPDDGTKAPSFAYDEAVDRTTLVVLIHVDGEGNASNYQTRLAAVEAQLAPRFRSVVLQSDTGVTHKAMTIAADAYTSVECRWRVIGATMGAVLVCTFIGEKAIKSEGNGSSGSAENPTGLETQIHYSYAVDERGINAVYATALLHGTAGSAFSSSSGALRRGRTWLDAIKAAPPSFVPTNARFVPGAVQVNGQNEEATVDCAWLTSATDSAVAQMSAAVRATQWNFKRIPQMLDANAGASGFDVEVAVKITYVTMVNTSVESATAAVAVDVSTIEGDARAALSNALVAAGIGSLVETAQAVYEFGSSGADVTVTFVGIGDGTGVVSWESSRVDTSTYTHGSVIKFPDGSEIVDEAAFPHVETQSVRYLIESTGPVTPPTLEGAYENAVSSVVAHPVVRKSQDGTVSTTVYEAQISGRKVRSA